MERLEINKILKLNKLNSELEYEKAISIYGRLRWMIKENEALSPVKQHLKALINKYEEAHWKDETNIGAEQMKESDIAERIISSENEFIHKRKELIRKKLKENGFSQKDLAKILGHRPNYMSELINGARPFSRNDLIVLHRLFKLDLNELVPPFLKPEVANHIKRSLRELKNQKSKIKLRLTDLEAL